MSTKPRAPWVGAPVYDPYREGTYSHMHPHRLSDHHGISKRYFRFVLLAWGATWLLWFATYLLYLMK
jgi:hypothetical protein